MIHRFEICPIMSKRHCKWIGSASAKVGGMLVVKGKAVVKGAYRCKQKIREKEHGGVARLDYGMQTKFSTSLVNKLFRINILGDH